MVVKLGPNARFSEHARKGMVFNFASEEGESSGGPGIRGPGGVGSAGCPDRDGEVLFDLQANWGSRFDDSRVHDLGQGPFTAQLWAKKPTANETSARNEEIRKDRAQLDAIGKELKKKDCRECRVPGGYDRVCMARCTSDKPFGESALKLRTLAKDAALRRPRANLAKPRRHRSLHTPVTRRSTMDVRG